MDIEGRIRVKCNFYPSGMLFVHPELLAIVGVYFFKTKCNIARRGLIEIPLTKGTFNFPFFDRQKMRGAQALG